MAIKKLSTQKTTKSPLKNLAALISRKKRFLTNLFLVVLIGTLVFFAAKRYRHLVIAATVNHSIISRFELNQHLVKRYGRTVLDELVSERLLLQESSSNQIIVNNEDVAAEIKKLEDSLGGKDNLDNAMIQYGLTQDDLNRQIKTRLLQQKLADKLFPIEVADEEIQKYYTDNKALFEGKKLEEVRDQIKTDLKSQQQQEKFGTWFQELRAKAQIFNYLTP